MNKKNTITTIKAVSEDLEQKKDLLDNGMETYDAVVQQMVPDKVFKAIRKHAIWGAVASAVAIIPLVGGFIASLGIVGILWHAYFKMTQLSGLRFSVILWKNILFGVVINIAFVYVVNFICTLGVGYAAFGLCATLAYIQVTYSCLLYLKSLSFIHKSAKNEENFVNVDFSVLWQDHLNEQAVQIYHLEVPDADEKELQQKKELLDNNKEFQVLKKLSWAMDNYYVSPIIGSAIPVLGDVLTSTPSFFLYSAAGYHTLKSKELVVSLLYNEIRGMFWSIIPAFGDVTDCEDKTYVKNYMLLAGYAIGNPQIITKVKKDVKYFIRMIIIYLIAFFMIASLICWGIYAFINWIGLQFSYVWDYLF